VHSASWESLTPQLLLLTQPVICDLGALSLFLASESEAKHATASSTNAIFFMMKSLLWWFLFCLG